MIKRILVPLDPSPYSTKALDMACKVANAHNAEVAGLVNLDAPTIKRSIGPVPAGASYYAKKLSQAKIKEAEKHIKQMLDEFKKTCDDYGVKHTEANRQGLPSSMILEESKFFDLLVIGKRTFFHWETSDEPGESFEEILDESITPILAVPKQYDMPDVQENPINVVIAYDGSYGASRALHRFAQLAIHGTVHVDIIMSHEDRDYSLEVLTDCEEYLNAHNICNIEKHWTSHNIISTIEKEYIKKAEMFVIGAHESRGILDFLVGSLMKFLIENSKVPILIGQ